MNIVCHIPSDTHKVWSGAIWKRNVHDGFSLASQIHIHLRQHGRTIWAEEFNPKVLNVTGVEERSSWTAPVPLMATPYVADDGATTALDRTGLHSNFTPASRKIELVSFPVISSGLTTLMPTASCIRRDESPLVSVRSSCHSPFRKSSVRTPRRCRKYQEAAPP